MFKPISICTRLTAALQYRIALDFTNIKPWAIVEKDRETEAEVTYMLSSGTGLAFAELKIGCSVDTHDPKIRHIDISAKMRHAEGPNKNFDNVSAEELMEKYRKLGINVIAGMSNQTAKESVTRIRTLEVRFTIFHGKIMVDDLSGRTYEFEMDIAKKAIPYIRALEDINEKMSLQLVGG